MKHRHLTCLTIYVGSTHQYQHHPLYVEIVRRAHQSHLAGASVFRGLEGYGASEKIHRNHPLRIASDLPIMIVIVDVDERLRAFVDELELLTIKATCVMEPVHAVEQK